MSTCDHKHPAFCDACGEWYDDRYADRIIQSMLDRIAKLEAQLGAATSGVVSGDVVASARETPSLPKEVRQLEKAAKCQPAAPSVSAEEWSGYAGGEKAPWKHLRSACDLAAWVTEFMGSKDNLSMDELLKLTDGLWAFVRGEKLPEVK